MLKRMNLRKLLGVALAGIMMIAVLALVGCSCSAQSSSSASSGSMSASDVSASNSSASSSESSSASSASSSAQPTVEAPNLVGMSMTDAQTVVDSLGLKLDATGNLDGIITSQDPAAGKQVDQGTTISVKVEDIDNWTVVPTAGEAAKAAGVDSLNVPDSVTMGSNTYSDPKFAYTVGAAQVVYDAPASGVIVRKTDASHTSLATDRDLSEFAMNWVQKVDGIDVICFGTTKDAATVIKWQDGTYSYGVTFQGYGGEEMTMTPDDIEALIAGIE